MTALLILGGVLLGVWGWLWLWLRSARIHWFWALAAVLPPLALLGGLLNVRQAFLPLLVHLAGLGLLGGGLWQLWHSDPQQLERLVRGHWSGSALPAVDVGRLQGQLQGQGFVPDRLLLEQGVLSLRQGQGLLASKEIRIDLRGHGPALAAEQFRLDILPTDNGPLPQLELLWLDEQSGQPQARRIGRGYTLRLEWQRQPGGLQGQLYLSLPLRLATVVGGDFLIKAADEQPDPDWQLAAAPVPVPAEPAVAAQPVAAATGRQLPLQQLLARPEHYLQRSLLIETVGGRQLAGQFQGVNEAGELLLRERIRTTGFVVFHLQSDEVREIWLQQP